MALIHGSRLMDRDVGLSTPTRPAAPRRRSWTIRRPLGIGLVAFVGLFGLTSAWAVTFDLSGAVIGKGQVQASPNRIAVQHPVGGVVAEILADNGDKVKEGDILLRLDDSQLRSDLAQVEGELFQVLATETELQSEVDDRKDLVPHPILLQAIDEYPDLRSLLDQQQVQLDAHYESIETQISLLKQETSQVQDQAAGVQASLDAKREELALLESELASATKNLNNGTITKTVVTTLQQQVIAARGEIGALVAKVAELKGKVAEQQLKMYAIPLDAKKLSAEKLNLLSQQSSKLIETRKGLLYNLSQLDVRAPVTGVVFDSKVLGPRSVISAAQPIMFIVPDNQPTLVVVRVEASDIDQVQVGQEAALRFTTFNRRSTPMIEGVVTAISADSFVDERTQGYYYFVDVSLQEDQLRRLGNLSVISGMPVDAYLATQPRTAASYVVKPLTDYFAKAFRD